MRDSAIDKVKTIVGHSNLAACKYFKIYTDVMKQEIAVSLSVSL